MRLEEIEMGQVTSIGFHATASNLFTLGHIWCVTPCVKPFMDYMDEGQLSPAELVGG